MKVALGIAGKARLDIEGTIFFGGIVMNKPENISQPGWVAIAVMLMILSIWLTDAITMGISAFCLFC